MNIQYPGEDDWCNFTLLMYELHQKRFNLPGITIEDFRPYCKNPYPNNVLKEMDRRIHFAGELVWVLYERRRDGRGDILTDW